ncbi:unnamed protein product [Periconia digitata]|uniref:Uncharacterized protein n=1 Tax=Periconia digitata TaxID=1303443 RepID=A0A9W4UAW9_9PLEO|nr:unnamed protein product [Periconia digitata]
MFLCYDYTHGRSKHLNVHHPCQERHAASLVPRMYHCTYTWTLYLSHCLEWQEARHMNGHLTSVGGGTYNTIEQTGMNDTAAAAASFIVIIMHGRSQFPYSTQQCAMALQ